MDLKQQKDTVSIPLYFYVSVTEKQQKGGVYPCLELRRVITSFPLIKSILSCAFHETPIITIPTFTNKILSLSSLVEKGVLYYNEKDKNYYFTR
jgi:hypothetical protein